MRLAIIHLKHVTVYLNNAKHKVTPNQCSCRITRTNSSFSVPPLDPNSYQGVFGKNKHGYTALEQQMRRTGVNFQYTALLREHLGLLMI